MYVLGVDIGTTGTKTMLIGETGRHEGYAYQDYPLIALADGGIEQRAQDWWRTLVSTVREATSGVAHKEEIKALSLSTQGGSCVLLGDNGLPLDNAHTWMDKRPDSVLGAFAGMEKHFYRTSGWPLGGAMMAARAVWFQRNRPGIWARARRYFTTADYASLRLTGRAAIDATNAAMTQLFDIRSMDWDDAILSAAGVPRSMLPDIVSSGNPIGTLTPEAAEDLGLAEGTLVVSGAHDQYAAAVGAGVYEPGDMMLSGGTAWVLLGITGKLAYDEDDCLCVGNHALPGIFGALSSIPTAGIGLEWCRKNFMKTQVQDGVQSLISYEALNEAAEARIRKDADLFFFPHFGGRGFPRWAPNSKGSFMGLSLEHDSYDMALAIMEGVAYDAAINIEAYAAKGFPCERLSLLGGASKSRLWTDILRHTTGLPLARFREADVACFGAAAFAATACGMFPSVRIAAKAINRCSVELLGEPGGPLREHYAQKYERYKKRLPFVEGFYNTD